MNKKMKISDYVAFFAGLLTLFLFILKFTFEPGMKWITVVSPLWIIYGIAIVQAIIADYVLRKQQQRKRDQEDFLKRFEPKEKPSLWQRRLAEMKYANESRVAMIEPEFIVYIKNERNAFSRDMLRDSWWLEIPSAKRAKMENILIAYDQMAEKLSSNI